MMRITTRFISPQSMNLQIQARVIEAMRAVIQKRKNCQLPFLSPRKRPKSKKRQRLNLRLRLFQCLEFLIMDRNSVLQRSAHITTLHTLL
jgi:hypothetical protein